VIYVVELPNQGDPFAWFAYDDDDFARKVAAGDALQPWEIYDEVTPRSLIEAVGHASVDEQARHGFPAICALGDEYGWDTPLYRADHLLGSGVLRVEPVTEREALTATLAARDDGLRCIYWRDQEAISAAEGATQPWLP